MEKSGLLTPARSINLSPCNIMNTYKKAGFLTNFNFRYHPLCCSPYTRVVLNTKCSTSSSMGSIKPPNILLPLSDLSIFGEPHNTQSGSQFLDTISVPNIVDNVLLMDLDPATAKLAISLLGPFLTAFGFLFVLRIVMSWYPKLPVEKFPYVIAYAPTEPILDPTRKLIPPLAGVDVTPVVWFGLISFLSEILVGPQGLLVLLSQKVLPS